MNTLVRSHSIGMGNSTMNVSPITMIDIGVLLEPLMLLMPVLIGNIVTLTVQVTFCPVSSVSIKITNLFSVEVCQTPCEFPFTYAGAQHDGCITHDNEGTPWCDIGNGTKGNCTSECPGNVNCSV